MLGSRLFYNFSIMTVVFNIGGVVLLLTGYDLVRSNLTIEVLLLHYALPMVADILFMSLEGIV